MPADTFHSAANEADAAADAAAGAAEHSQKAFAEALAAAEKTLTEAAKTAEKAIREGVDMLLKQSRTYSHDAGAQVEEAQQYVMERVKERPVTATLAGLGVGLLLGLLLSNRSK